MGWYRLEREWGMCRERMSEVKSRKRWNEGEVGEAESVKMKVERKIEKESSRRNGNLRVAYIQEGEVRM